MNQGEIIIVPFMFTDLSMAKMRPALIISSDNHTGDDYIVCAITSKQKYDKHAIYLTNSDLEYGKLSIASYIQPGKITTVHKSLVEYCLGKIKKSLLAKVLFNIHSILEIP